MKFIKTWLLALMLVVHSVAHAQLPAVPPNVSDLKKQPMVVLNMSKDHQLFYRAYNEYTDINLDGVPDTTYNHSIDYYGYFDTHKCYQYDGSKFAPVGVNTNKYCTSQWSGNFLNWSTMARIDVVRKVLYGGYRSTDTASSTVLERTYLPNDAHSFAKYYNGADLPQLTPFTAAEVAAKTVTGVFTTPVGGITICNTTLGSSSGNNRYSQTNTNPPLMRVAFGDFSLWNANQRWQCLWRGEKGASNGNQPLITGLNAASSNPNITNVGLKVGAYGPDFNLRVEVCNSAFLGKENCTQYPSGNYKPVGLMHEFGSKDQAEFALITGSFTNNISGGVLRRNMNSFMSEINKTTDGTYNSEKGIAYTLNKMRIFGYDHDDGTYGGDRDNSNNWCTYQITGLVNNQCTSWGNPIGEMYLESLRYLAGKQPTPGFAAGAKDLALGLTTETWEDPYTRPSLTAAQRQAIEITYGKAQCRPISVLNFNASAISYDLDDLSGLSDLGTGNINSLLTTIGEKEGINGTQRLVGRIVGGSAAETNRLCDLKTVNSLTNVDGVCPDAPAYKGSYSLAGLAYWAHTNKIRSDFAATKKGPLTVDTYSIALNPGTPIISVVAQDGSGKKALIQPAYRLQKSANSVGGGTLVDFRIVTQTPTYGKYLLVWEDSEQGGDYDQDVTGTLEYRVVGDKLEITTFVFADATVNPQGFGYVLSGADKNGAHFHSGIIGFNFTDSTSPIVTGTNPAKLNATGGCNDCRVNDPATTAKYTIAGGNLGALPDPLLLAAKWGGFKDSTTNPTNLPDNVNKWDVQKQDGSAGADGLPDNYFVVYRPDLLETALRQAFGKIAERSNATPAVALPVLSDGTLIYNVDFSPDTLAGKLFAAVFNTATVANPTIFGHVNLTAVPSNLRQVITNVRATGAEFTYASIDSKISGTAYLSSLIGTTTATVTTTTSLINYLRGDRSQEMPGGIFRRRDQTSILGSIINSSPWIQRNPTAALFGKGNEGYANFANAQKLRNKLLWVGAGDGMLHGFMAKDLMPVISYVPEPLVPTIKKYADPSVSSVTALMDGNAATADVNMSENLYPKPGYAAAVAGDWRTYLFSSLGRGGKGIFALDVTDTGSLSQGAAANIFKWQFTSADDADLGHIISDGGVNPDTGQAAGVVRMPNGKFAYIAGNGVDSATGKAVLYILYVQGPTPLPNNNYSWTNRYHKIVLDNGTGNGLMQPFWLDSDDDGVVDTIYAGDLKGNMWKVNVRSSDPTQWGVAYNKPLYSAKAADGTTPLPITGAPAVAFHPGGGVVVVFGTGKSIFSNDFPNNALQQRVYGIWDKRGYQTTPGDVPSGITELQQRVWTVESGTNDPIQTNLTAIDWSSKKGWFVNIPYTSGMVIHNMLFAQDGSTEIGIPIIYPTANIITSDACTTGVYGTYAQVDAITGIQPSSTFGVGKVGQSTPDQNFTIVRRQSGSDLSQAIVGPTTLITTAPRTRETTRLYWREVPGIKTFVAPDTDKQ